MWSYTLTRWTLVAGEGGVFSLEEQLMGNDYTSTRPKVKIKVICLNAPFTFLCRVCGVSFTFCRQFSWLGLFIGWKCVQGIFLAHWGYVGRRTVCFEGVLAWSGEASNLRSRININQIMFLAYVGSARELVNVICIYVSPWSTFTWDVARLHDSVNFGFYKQAYAKLAFLSVRTTLAATRGQVGPILCGFIHRREGGGDSLREGRQLLAKRQSCATSQASAPA